MTSESFDQPVDHKFKAVYVAIRVILIGGLLVGAAFDLAQLEGKGWTARFVFYTIVAFVLPFAWRLSNRRFAWSYLADAFLAAPFTLDILGNLFGLYDSVAVFDDILHFVNWALLVACFTVSVSRSSNVSRLNLVALGTGFGSTMIVLWELLEFLIMKLGTEALNLTYEDTVGDIGLSTLGGLVGSLLIALLLSSKERDT